MVVYSGIVSPYLTDDSGGWKNRSLTFGKEDPYSQNALYPYVGVHKAASYIEANDRTNAAWENAAHASVTGVGLLFLTKSKALDIPVGIINLVPPPTLEPELIVG